MISAELKEIIAALCPEVEPEFLGDFTARMDDDYFGVFSPEEICAHLRMARDLDLEHPVQSRITPLASGQFDIIIVGFDYLSEFSIFCGLLSAFGLDIYAGRIYSSTRRTEASGPPRRSPKLRARRPLPSRIVDFFSVRLKSVGIFDEVRQQEFDRELRLLVRLLAAGSSEQARDRLNRYLVERLEQMNEQPRGLLSPIEVLFDNQTSPDWTVMDVRSEDAFTFLYAFSSALSMRGIYIHKVKIQSVGSEVRDQFFIADKWGRKIESEQEQARLRSAVVLIKQFTLSLPEAPDAARALRHFNQFLDKIAEEEISPQFVSYFTGQKGMSLLAQLLGSSDFLWEEFLRLRFRELLPMLPTLEEFGGTGSKPDKESLRNQLAAGLAEAATFEDRKRALNQFKDRQVFWIDILRLLDRLALEAFSQALTDLAEVVLESAAAQCYVLLAEEHGEPVREDGRPATYAICGLGKFGGREMGYASDLEILFVHEGEGQTPGPQPLDNGLFFELLVQRVIDFIEAREKGVFHLDLRLRPHGKAGPLASPLEQLMAYYDPVGEAVPFERQALIKLRWVAGDESLGRRVEAHRDRFTYSGLPWDWENALHLRQRQIRELAKPGQVNVKYSRGGIIDVEYKAQYLQLLYGKDYSELRTTNTLQALFQLRRLEIISKREHEELHRAYLFLRELIDALRIVRGDASDLVLPPADSEEFKSLARRLGYRQPDRVQSAQQLAADIKGTMEKVHAYYVNRFDPIKLESLLRNDADN
ncbi:MAG TPA: hypothetical protein VJ302_14260 [Blastocatellia bacterium]|nr:hypothetical protein [Blastocatellia bacterium]